MHLLCHGFTWFVVVLVAILSVGRSYYDNREQYPADDDTPAPHVANATLECLVDGFGRLVPEACPGRLNFSLVDLDLGPYKSPKSDVFGVVSVVLERLKQVLLRVLSVNIWFRQQDLMFTLFEPFLQVDPQLVLANSTLRITVPLAQGIRIPVTAVSSEDLRTVYLDGTTPKPARVVLDVTTTIGLVFGGYTYYSPLSFNNTALMYLNATLNATDFRMVAHDSKFRLIVEGFEMAFGYDIVSSETHTTNEEQCAAMPIPLCDQVAPVVDNLILNGTLLNSQFLRYLSSETVRLMLEAGVATPVRQWEVEYACALSFHGCDDKEVAAVVSNTADDAHIWLLILVLLALLGLGQCVAGAVMHRRRERGLEKDRASTIGAEDQGHSLVVFADHGDKLAGEEGKAAGLV